MKKLISKLLSILMIVTCVCLNTNVSVNAEETQPNWGKVTTTAIGITVDENATGANAMSLANAQLGVLTDKTNDDVVIVIYKVDNSGNYKYISFNGLNQARTTNEWSFPCEDGDGHDLSFDAIKDYAGMLDIYVCGTVTDPSSAPTGVKFDLRDGDEPVSYSNLTNLNPTSSTIDSSYSFYGWSTEIDGWKLVADPTTYEYVENYVGIVDKTGGTDANNYDINDFSSNTTYYAVWKKNGHIVITNGFSTWNLSETNSDIYNNYGIKYKNDTLYLNNVTINPSGLENVGLQLSSSNPMTLSLSGSNQIGKSIDRDNMPSETSAYSVKTGVGTNTNLVITGEGSLTINDMVDGIDGTSNSSTITFDNSFSGTLTINDYGEEIYDGGGDACCISAENIIINNGTFDLYSCNAKAINAGSELTISGGTITAYGTTAVYALDGLSISGSGKINAYGVVEYYSNIQGDFSSEPAAFSYTNGSYSGSYNSEWTLFTYTPVDTTKAMVLTAKPSSAAYNDCFGTQSLSYASYTTGTEYTVHDTTKYKFLGWSSTQDEKNNIVSTEPTTGTYYAVWENANGKVVVTKELDFTAATSPTLPTDCGITWDAANYKLTLDGATIDCSNITVTEQYGKTIVINLPDVTDGVTIEIGDDSTINCGKATNYGSTYGIYSSGKTTFAKVNGKNGILTINDNTAYTTYCIGTLDDITINGASLNLIANKATNAHNSNCLSAYDAGRNEAKLVINDGSIIAESNANGSPIFAANTIEIKGGKVETINGFNGIYTNTFKISDGTVETKGNPTNGIRADVKVNITGGTVKVKGSSNAISYTSELTIDSGMAITGANETYTSGTTTSLTNVSGTEYVTISPGMAAIGTTAYTSIAKALNAAHAGESETTPTVIKLLDSTSEKVTIDSGRYITLDLNGKTLSAVTSDINSSSIKAINNKGALTILDNSSTPGKIENIGGEYSTTISNEGTLSISGISIESSCTGGQAIAINNMDGSLTLNSNNITVDGSGQSYGLYITNGTATLNSNKINVTSTSTEKDNYCIRNTSSGNITLNGDELTVTGPYVSIGIDNQAPAVLTSVKIKAITTGTSDNVHAYGIYNCNSLTIGGNMSVSGTTSSLYIDSKKPISISSSGLDVSSAMSVIICDSDYETENIVGTFASGSGISAYSSFFKPTVDKYKVASTNDALEIKERSITITQNTSDTASVSVNTDGLTAVPTYQWKTQTEYDLEDCTREITFPEFYDSSYGSISGNTITCDFVGGGYAVLLDDSDNDAVAIQFKTNNFNCLTDDTTSIELQNDNMSVDTAKSILAEQTNLHLYSGIKVVYSINETDSNKYNCLIYDNATWTKTDPSTLEELKSYSKSIYILGTTVVSGYKVADYLTYSPISADENDNYTIYFTSNEDYGLENGTLFMATSIGINDVKIIKQKDVDGQTASNLTGADAGDYLCKVIFADGTYLTSDTVTVSIPALIHDDSSSDFTVSSGKGYKEFTKGSATESAIHIGDLDLSKVHKDFIVNKYTGILVMNGTNVLTEGTDYTVTEGSVKINLTDTYLNSLGVGTHTINVYVNTAGDATKESTGHNYEFEVTVKVNAAASSGGSGSTYKAPKTGIEADNTNNSISKVVGLLSLVTLAGYVVIKKKED